MTITRTKVITHPCVIIPSNSKRQHEQHVTHGTHWRAKRNALATSYLGYRYHVHETTVPTLWGRLVTIVRWLKKGVA